MFCALKLSSEQSQTVITVTRYARRQSFHLNYEPKNDYLFTTFPQLFLFLIFTLVSDSAEIGKVFWERKMATQANVAREPAKADLALFPTVIDIHSNHTALVMPIRLMLLLSIWDHSTNVQLLCNMGLPLNS